jgi:hypothetical protein
MPPDRKRRAHAAGRNRSVLGRRTVWTFTAVSCLEDGLSLGLSQFLRYLQCAPEERIFGIPIQRDEAIAVLTIQLSPIPDLVRALTKHPCTARAPYLDLFFHDAPLDARQSILSGANYQRTKVCRATRGHKVTSL